MVEDIGDAEVSSGQLTTLLVDLDGALNSVSLEVKMKMRDSWVSANTKTL